LKAKENKVKQRLLLVVLVIMLVSSLSATMALGQDAAPVPDILTLPDQIAGGRDVTITVSNMPSADQADLRTAWEAQAARFEALYPNVHIQGNEIQYDPAAFTALIAGGELPTLFRTYFTEPSKLIPQGVVADITQYFQAAGVADVFNPSILSITSQDGAVYGIPFNAYALGLAYNISMLHDAGFDHAPTTWDELETMAAALTDRDNNVSGFALINAGTDQTGWHFTAMAYSLGATRDDIIGQNDDGTYVANYGTAGATVDALNLIHDLRWTYDVLPGSTLAWDSESEALMSGRIAMAIYAGDQFNYDYFQFPDADLSNFGYAPLPAGPNGSMSTLSGGNIWVVAANADADQQEAAAYYQLWRQFDPAEVQASLEASTEAIGMPTLPLYVGDYQTAWLAFRAPYNKLPVENYAEFNDAVLGGQVTLQPEPITAVQDYYTEVGVVVGEVLSNENVDTAARLADSATEFQSFVLDSQ
jgi:multiple sugar transport system substrate-binding protein